MVGKIFMKSIDLTKTLKPYTSGWVALDAKLKIVAHEKDFESISERVKDREDVVLMPASKSYFGFIT